MENSVNIIFAVTQKQYEIYSFLKNKIEGSSLGTLEDDSSNIVHLIQNQYQAITSSIVMSDNSTSSVKVTYYSSCMDNGSTLRKTNKCSGLKVGSRVEFVASIEVIKCPEDPQEWKQMFHIFPIGINESMAVDLEMMCQCNCEKPASTVRIC